MLRPTQSPVVGQSIGHDTVGEGEATTWHIAIDDPEQRIDDVAVVLDTPTWVERRPVDGQTAVSLADDGVERLALVVRPTRWGCHQIGPALVVASSAWGGFRWASRSWAQQHRLVTMPQPSRFDAAAPPVHVPGLVGVNRAPRYGSGSEFASIRPFQQGDRLRRIHWPRSLRTGELHVTTTWADNDRHVVLMIDAFDDIGVSGGIEGRSSSLDISVRAAAAIAEHFVRIGDRVALVMIGARRVQRVPPGSGFRHLRRLLEGMASIEPAHAVIDDGRLPPGLSSGALVVMLSPLTSSRSLQRARSLADRGLGVIVIDCLPADIADEQPGDPYVALAWRIERLEARAPDPGGQRGRHRRRAVERSGQSRSRLARVAPPHRNSDRAIVMSLASPVSEAGNSEAWSLLTRARGVGLLLRVMIGASALVALGCTMAAADDTLPIVKFVIVVLALVCVVVPDGPIGLLVVVLIGIEWLATVDDVTTPWSIAAAASLTVFHVSLAAASVVPPSATWTRSMCRRWGFRCLIVMALGCFTWAVVAALQDRNAASSEVLLAASVLTLAIAGVWVRSGSLAGRRAA